MKVLLTSLVAALALASTATGAPAPTHPATSRMGWYWNEIASYYAGRPMTVAFTTTTSSAYTDGFGHAYLGEVAKDKLTWLFLHARDPKRGPQGGVVGIMSLVHEALHNRDRDMSERQVGILGCQLVPDALERFFGVPQSSQLGRRYAALAEECAQPWLAREE